MVNKTNGGEGASGYIHSEATKLKIAEIVRQNWEIPEVRDKQVAAMVGVTRSATACANLSAAKKNPSQATRERHAEAARRSWLDPAWRANQIEKRRNPSEQNRALRSAAAQRRCERDGAFGTGRIWITNGRDNRRILPEETIPEGWRLGATQDRSRVNVQSGVIWITDGKSNRRIHPTTAIPEGWRIGATQKRQNSEGVTR